MIPWRKAKREKKKNHRQLTPNKVGLAAVYYVVQANLF